MRQREYTEEEDAEYYRYLAEEERKAKLAGAGPPIIPPEDEPTDEEYLQWLAEQELNKKVEEIMIEDMRSGRIPPEVFDQPEPTPSSRNAPPPIQYNTSGVKVVSLGITNHVGQSPRDAEIAKRVEKTEKFQKYVDQMAADRDRVIEETRKPYARRQYDPNDAVERFTIGQAIDADTLRQQKRQAQLDYQRQLQADQQSKPIEGDRKKFPQKHPSSGPPSPLGGSHHQSDRNPSGMAAFGRDEEYDKMVKKRAAIEVQLRNTDLAYANREMKAQNRQEERYQGGDDANSRGSYSGRDRQPSGYPATATADRDYHGGHSDYRGGQPSATDRYATAAADNDRYSDRGGGGGGESKWGGGGSSVSSGRDIRGGGASQYGLKGSVGDYGDRGNDIRKFEDAQYRYIGGQEDDAKARKAALAQQYMQQLNADAARAQRDNNSTNDRDRDGDSHYGGGRQQYSGRGRDEGDDYPAPRGPTSYGQGPPSPDIYGNNQGGWSGLNIGGGNSHQSSGAQLNSKHAAQLTYKQQLDKQREEALEIMRQNEYKYAMRELR